MCCAHVRTHWELLLWLADPGHLTMFDPHFGYASVGHLAQSHALTCHETAKPRGVCPTFVPSSAVQGIVGQAADETSQDKRMDSVCAGGPPSLPLTNGYSTSYVPLTCTPYTEGLGRPKCEG